MKKIGLFYGTGGGNTEYVAKKIQQAFRKEEIELVPIERVNLLDFERFTNLIAGVSTWFDGELPIYWDEVLPELENTDLKGKKVAIFGLGDQLGYPDNFADGVGILADIFKKCGAELVGKTSVDGYCFNHSSAQEGDDFQGLLIDLENQPEKTDVRITDWVKQLKKVFD